MKKSSLIREISKKYKISLTRSKHNANGRYRDLNIHAPSFINIPIDSRFRIEENENCWQVWNSRVCVNLWKEVSIMHVTVLNY